MAIVIRIALGVLLGLLAYGILRGFYRRITQKNNPRGGEE